VVAIIGLLSALAMPAVSAMNKSNSRAQAVNQVRALFAAARSMAMAQHRMVGVVFFEETSKYARPVHGGQTAMQIFAEAFDQASYNPAAGNTVFVALGGSRDYLPAGIKLAVLNDDAARGVTTGDESSATVGRTRAVLFDATGRVISRHGLARPDLDTAQPGAYPWAMGDWGFTTKGRSASLGISSPGFMLYDKTEFAAAHIPTDNSPASNAARNAWVKAHSTVIVINANTGAPLP
jgi:type II secretory pathway pseudopilin PulG